MSQRVLIVDDNTDNRKLLAWVLEDAGYEFEESSSAEEALERLRAGAFDAVLMDVGLPGMQGDEATREIRCDPSLAPLPVIAVTAHAIPADLARIEASGVSAIVTKPIDEDELVETLELHLGKG